MKTIEDVMITTRLLPHARRTPSLILRAALAAAMFFAMVPAARAQQNYKTVDAAVDALVATAKSGDQKAALVVLGPGGDDIISSGDKVADDAARARFVASYDTKHEIKMEGDDKASLIIGDNDYPFPIPLMRKDGKWLFDTEAGRREILARRIGHNELDAIQVCLAFVDAQDEYYYKILTRQGPHAPGGAIDYVANGKMIGGFALVAYPAQYRNSGVVSFMVSHT